MLSADRLEERLSLLLAQEDVYNLQGAWEAQEQDLYNLQKWVERLDNPSARGIVTLRRARYVWRTGAESLARSLLQETLPLIAAIQDIQDRAQSYLEWGRLRWHDGNKAVAVTAQASLEKAIDLAHAAGLKDIEAESLRELGLVCSYLHGNSEQALFYLQRGLQLSRETGNRKLEGIIYNALSDILDRTGTDTDAYHYLELGTRLCRETGNRYDEGWGVHGLADFYYRQGDYATALRHYKRAAVLACETQTVGLAGFALRGVNRVFGDLGQFAEAIAYYERVLHNLREAGNPVMVGVALFYLGLYAHYAGDDVRSRDCGQEISRIGQALAEEHVQMWAWMILGHALMGLGQLAEARATYQRALAAESRSIGFEGWWLWFRASLIRIALLKGKTEALREALPHAEAFLDYWETHPALRGISYEPFAICWTSYRLLKALQDPRAPEVLDRLYALVRAKADKLQDPEHQRMFLENVAVHRDIIAEFENIHNTHDL